MNFQARASVLRHLAELGFFSLVINLLTLAVPLYLLQVYDRVLPSASISTLAYITIFALMALGLMSFIEAVRGVYASRVSSKLDIANSQAALQASLNSPRSAIGDVQPLRDLATVRRFVGGRSVFLLFDLPFIPIFIGLLWFMHPLLFWITLGGGVTMTLLALANQAAAAGVLKRGADQGAQAMMTAQSFVRNAETLRAMAMVGNAIRAWSDNHVPTLNAADKAAWINAVFGGVSRFLRMALQVAILGVGAWLVLDGQMTAGMIFATSLISARGLQPIDQAVAGWPQIVEAQFAWSRIRGAIAAAGASRTYTAMPPPVGRLQVEGLVYAAPGPADGQPPIIKRVSFAIEPGSVLGIIGPSGAGKSTLARLLVGAIRPSAGVVRIDGLDLQNWDPEVIGSHIGYLAQDVELFAGTIADNVGRFSEDRQDEAIIEAAKRAQVHDLIVAQPKGYDTWIGPLGMTLSGGQRQRVGLARAFFGGPRLLVLDEPNANLDAEGETALDMALEQAKAMGATIIIVTQRRNVLGKLDFILTMRNGVAEDFGPRDEVLSRQEKRRKAEGLAARSGHEGASETAQPLTVINGTPARASFVQYTPRGQQVGSENK